MKIVVSGGHLTPALAFIDYARRQKQVEIIFVGRELSQTKNRQPSVEREEVSKRGVKFIAFSSGKLTRPHVGELFFQAFAFLGAIGKAFFIFKREKPDVFVSFGGYLAVPLAIGAWVQRIPIITHEQTRVAGVANKVIARFARKVAVSYPESTEYFPSKKVTVTGNPIRLSLLTPQPRPSWLNENPEKPILYVTGGSQGSQLINHVVGEMLPQLTKEWTVIHQCGRAAQLYQPLVDLEKAKEALPTSQRKQYFVREWVTENELGWIYAHMRLIISRSGANTVQEIQRVGKPAIFIPLALAHDDEQRKNAEAVVETGAALLILQKETTPQHLLQAIQNCQEHYAAMSRAAKQNSQQVNTSADQALFDLVLEVLS